MPDKRRERKSKYTADRQIPGAFEGETVTRRRFMVGSTHALGAAATSAFALPALGFALGPVFERQKFDWQDVGSLGEIPNDTYVPRVITIVKGIGEAGKSTVYLRQRNEGDAAQGIPALDTEPADKYNKVVALSTRCMHLGCPVRFVAAAQRFVCPCHGGVYDFTGRVSGGPPVRPLDRFYTQIVGTGPGARIQLGPRYSVNSHLQRFSPRDPGEPIDGIGQYLYPARFSTPRK